MDSVYWSDLAYIYKYTMMYQSNTTKFIMFIIVLGQNIPVLIESYDIDPYLAMFEMRSGIPNAYILDPTAHFKHC